MTPAFNEKKFQELVVYLALVCADDATFGATKIHKVLFYADFTSYLRTGQAITGATYQKNTHGPTAREFLPQKKELERAHAIGETVGSFGPYEQRRVAALREPDMGLFSSAEIAIVDEILRLLKDKTATEASKLSHAFGGWKLADEHETIPYESVLVDYRGVNRELDPVQQSRYDEIKARVLSEVRAAKPES